MFKARFSVERLGTGRQGEPDIKWYRKLTLSGILPHNLFGKHTQGRKERTRWPGSADACRRMQTHADVYLYVYIYVSNKQCSSADQPAKLQNTERRVWKYITRCQAATGYHQ